MNTWFQHIIDLFRGVRRQYVERAGVVDLTPGNICRIDKHGQRPNDGKTYRHGWHGRVVMIESKENHGRVVVRDGRGTQCMFGVEDLAAARLGDEQDYAAERAKYTEGKTLAEIIDEVIPSKPGDPEF